MDNLLQYLILYLALGIPGYLLATAMCLYIGYKDHQAKGQSVSINQLLEELSDEEIDGGVKWFSLYFATLVIIVWPSTLLAMTVWSIWNFRLIPALDKPLSDGTKKKKKNKLKLEDILDEEYPSQILEDGELIDAKYI